MRGFPLRGGLVRAIYSGFSFNSRILLANGSCRRQHSKASRASLCPWALVEPGHNPLHIHRGGGGDVLEVGFREPPIPGVPQPKAAYALGERPFDAGAPFIALLPFGTPIPRPCRLECLKFGLRV